MKKLTFSGLALAGLFTALFSGEEPFVYNHTVHTVGQEMNCADCHERVMDAKDLKGGLLPAPSSCADCHEESLVKAYAGHLEMIPNKPAKFASLAFSHAAHNAVACADCHGLAYSEEKPPPDAGLPLHGPTMEACAKCHDNRKAPSSCAACHEDLSLLRPATHGPFWRTRAGHGLSARLDEASCAACHKKSECSDCHAGRFGQAVHEVNYEWTHGLDARFKSLDCAVCHVERTFCADCHENSK